MSNNHQPFNQMRTAYTCQSCGREHAGTPVRSPSGVMMGRVMMEKYVCPECQAKHAESLKRGFWGMEKLSDKPGCCPGCNCTLDGDSFLAHHELDASGRWKMLRVCRMCFGECKEVCCSNMA